MMGTPTRFKNGIASIGAGRPYSAYPLPDPFHTGSKITVGLTEVKDDFHSFATGDWTVTPASTGTAAAASVVGGAVTLTTAAVLNDTVYISKPSAGFKFTVGNQTWVGCRFKVDVPTTADYSVGLAAPGAVPMQGTIQNGIIFSQVGGTTNVSLDMFIGGVKTDLIATALTPAADTYYDVDFHYDGANVNIFLNDAKVATVAVAAWPTALLTPIACVKTTDAAAKALTLDYYIASQEVAR